MTRVTPASIAYIATQVGIWFELLVYSDIDAYCCIRFDLHSALVPYFPEAISPPTPRRFIVVSWIILKIPKSRRVFWNS